MPVNKYTFERPPVAPIFRPSLKEFDDPLGYIEKIRGIAEKFGICKIVSPKQWNPPFSVDHNTFKFRPRVQRLNELGAQYRLRSNFLRCIEAYWQYQSSPLIIPTICGVTIDLFTLHSKVSEYGGSYQVTKNKQWVAVTSEMGIADNAHHISFQVKAAYEKLIQPYLDFCDDNFMKANKELFPDDVPPTRIQGKTAMTIDSPKLTRSKIPKYKTQTVTSCTICESDERASSMVVCIECGLRYHTACLLPPLSDLICPWTCSRCMKINCARELCRLNAEVFGFTQSTSKYSLDSFATYADNFKRTYFNDRNNVSMKEVEEEYWRLVEAVESEVDVTVKYGADISSGVTSSGFPTKNCRHLLTDIDQKYIDDGWNLNNLPTVAKSALRFVDKDISGMTVPWCYVGMVFSCFCWHIEDHWSYSVNYMHVGECKTWYCVPESDADLFEQLMRTEAGQLFDKSPDLLHHITTQINPTKLIANNIKVYRLDQAPGEFVITFPRAYHAGFNHGFNFAEAVNLCPADWLSKGRASVASYRLVKRPTIFSHTELICRMAATHDSLDIGLLRAVYAQIVAIYHDEKVARQGICHTERLPLDPIQPAEERECSHCRTTLYLSMAMCTVCSKPVCIDHISYACHCPTMDNVILKYRLSIDEISALVTKCKNKLDQYNLWMRRLYHLSKSQFCTSPVSTEEARVMKNVTQYLEDLDVLQLDDIIIKSVEEKPNIEELKMLLQLGRKMNCPELLLDFLEAIIDTCQRAMTMTERLLKSHKLHANEDNKENDEHSRGEFKSKKNKERKCNKIISPYMDQNDKLTLREMRMLVEKLRSLPAHVPQLEEAAQTLDCINEWRKKVKRIVCSNDVMDERILTELIEAGQSNLVYLSEYQMLQRMRVHTIWVAEARQKIGGQDKLTLSTLSQLKKLRDEGLGLVNTVEISRIATLSEQLEINEEEEEGEEENVSSNGNGDVVLDYRGTGWKFVIENLRTLEKQLSKIISDGEAMQKEADDILKSTPGMYALSALKALLKSAENKLNCVVPGIERLKEVLKEALIVNTKVSEMWQKLQMCRRLVHIDDIQALIKQADSLCVTFNHLSELKSLNDTVESWKKNLHNLFIKGSHNSYLTTPSLLEVLFPRPPRVFKLMIARESVSSKLVAACKAESSSKKEDSVKEEMDSYDEDKQSEEQKVLRNTNRAARKSRGRQKRASFSSDDPQIARKDNLTVFESFLKSNNNSDVESFNSLYKNMCINELEWMWNLRELNEDKANKDSSGHDFYCFCRKRGIDQKGAQVMCDLCQDWFHLACLGIQNKDMSKKKFLCPQCERSKRPAFEVILAEKRKLEQEAKMLKIPEYIGLCLMSQRVISFHKHTNQLFSPQTELGAVFAEYKKLFGVQAILPKYQQPGSVSGHHEQSPTHDHQVMETPLMNMVTGKQSRKTPHSMSKSGISTTNYPGVVPSTPVQLSPVPSKETLINIRRLKVSLSEDARRELEEIYIELCLLEVNQPTVTWIWKLYHSLIDDDDDEDENVSERDTGKYVTKKEQSTEQMSDFSDTNDINQDKFDARGLDYMSKLLSKASKNTKRLDVQTHSDKYIKSECLTSPEERKEPLQKFSFKRKLVAKNLVKAPSTVKKQTSLKSSRSVTTRKRGRGGKNTSTYRDVWDINPDIASEYYDEENDVILLDNVTIHKQSKSKQAKTKSGSVKSVSDSKSMVYDDNPPAIATTSSKHKSTTARQRKQSSSLSYAKQISTEKSDYSDENSPSQLSYDVPKVPKRGRKPSIARDTASTSSVLKRRRKASGAKRVCNDDCEADECIQQSSDKVNWIACDLCNLWYHWICVGIKLAIEIGDRFICPHCKESNTGSSGSKKHIMSHDHRIVAPLPALLASSSLVEEMDETDDLNVTLDDEVTDNMITAATATTAITTTTPLSSSSSSHNNTAYFHATMSPPPPFLQPECCVQEEVVEISYVSRSDSD